jgi:putative ABC transport system ATP-binding protein
MEPVIQLIDYRKTYRNGAMKVEAVRGVSMEIFPGEFVAIMGTSGSGKSTMMNTIGCLDRPTSGTYFLDGVNIQKLNKDQLAQLRNRKLGFVFQGFNLLSRTSALENVELPMLYTHPAISSREQQRRAMAALAQVGLADRHDHHPNQLSGGQQQRVAIARALVNQPKVLLADEPTGNLDTRTSVEVMGVFQSLNEAGMTIVMVTHEQEIAGFSQRKVVMRDGVIREDGPVARRLHASQELARLAAETPPEPVTAPAP